MKSSSSPIHIPFHQHGGYVGGIVTFMQNLRVYLDAHHYPYTETLETSNTLFFPVRYDKHTLNLIKKSGGRIIQRLDGIYHQKKHGNEYHALNQPIQEIYDQYADHIVFQSEYSRQQCFRMFEEKGKTTYSIVHNGVHKNTFTPKNTDSLQVQEKVRFITTGGFRNKDMLEPIIEALDQLESEFDFELTIVGPIQGDSVLPYVKRKYVRHIGERDGQQVSALLQKAHIFLYSIANPACPNSVLEAISTGLPVVGFDSGAMRELCYFSKDLLAHVSGDVFQDYRDFDPRKLREKISLAVAEYPTYRERALAHSHLYSFEETGAAYVQIFDRVQQEAAKTFNARRFRRLNNQYELESRTRRWYGAAKNKLLGKP